jgi:hypothetical protein
MAKGGGITEAHSKIKLQSAIEYLTTYSWAIILIAIVLFALYALGVFNPYTFAPKAQPGSCEVYRPDGPWTTRFIKLVGACNGELPEYVMTFQGLPSANKINAYVNVSRIPLNNVSFTFSAWIYGINLVNSSNVRDNIILSQTPISGSCTTDGCLNISVRNDVLHFGFFQDDLDGVTHLHDEQWYFAAFVYNASKHEKYIYIDGGLDNSSSSSNFTGTSGNTLIGMLRESCGCVNLFDYFNGQISDVQLYSTPFSANEINTLYISGIGGAPTDLQHLTGWWPLNGDANDYSGNGDNGGMWNVSFKGPYLSGYTIP